MNRLFSAARRLRGLIAVSAATITISLAIATPVHAASEAAPEAGSEHALSIRGVAACDADAREWVITWTLTNLSEATGTIGNVRAYPAGRALVGMPNRIQAGETINGVQRTLASEYTASLEFDVNWDDGLVTYNHNWPTYIHSWCAAV
jgi:hypothetical protein